MSVLYPTEEDVVALCVVLPMIRVSHFHVSSQEAECLLCFLCDGAYVNFLIPIVVYVYANVFCCADVLQVVSV